MGKYVQRIQHKGKEILFINGAGTGPDEGLAAWEEMRLELSKPGGARMILVDATNTRMEPREMKKASEAVDVMKKMPGTPVAFVGMKTFLKTSAQLMSTRLRLNAHFCNSLEEAKEWLVSEDARRAQG